MNPSSPSARDGMIPWNLGELAVPLKGDDPPSGCLLGI